jgi:molybdate transport system substrate-binding protein
MRSVLRHATLPLASLAACFAALIALGIGGLRAEEVTFFAAASTADAVNAVTARYAATVPGEGRDGPVVRPVFAASSTLAKQIVQGAPAQLFLSASNEWMDYLERRHAIDPASRVDLLGNRLVLVTPADSRLSLAIAPGFPLARGLDGGWLAIGDPAHVPAGIYAKAALETLGVWPEVAGKTARTADVRAALALVDRGEAAAGIVYRSDLEIGNRVQLAGVFPETSHPPITYPLAKVAGPSSDAAERFYRFLLGPEARAIFRAHGFRGPGGEN